MRFPIWAGALHDLRYAARTFRRSPGFTAAALISLSLGIGANTAVFTLLNALMLRTLPVRDPGQLVEFLQKYPGEPRGNGYFSWSSYEHYRDHNRAFSTLIASCGPSRLAVRGNSLAQDTATVTYVVGDFFQSLGLQPALGRLIGSQDAASQVAVVSWSWWKNRFNQDPSILGKQLVVQDSPVTIIGVAPRAFLGLHTGTDTDIWLPRPPTLRAGLTLLARLRSGVSIDEARAEMSVLYQYTIEERAAHSKDPLVRQLKIEVEPAGRGLSQLRDLFARPLLLLMAVVALLLLIACANLASLLLARGAARRHEMAVRAALGAGRRQLLRQVLTEALLLSSAGSLGGILLAYLGAGALLKILTSGRIIGLPHPLEISLSPDAHVLMFTAGVALATGILFGLAPAWSASSTAPASSLRESQRIGESRLQRLSGKALVAAQVALSVMLLSAAGLFLRHLAGLENVDLGFRRDHVLLVSLDPSRSGYSAGRLSNAYRDLLNRLDSIPGVRSATISAPTPLSGAGASGFASVEGYQERPEDRRYISISYVAPRYFETLGTPLLAGRDFRFEDDVRANAAIISQTFARYYFAGRNPIGKHVTLFQVTGVREPRTYEIVGVAADANYYEIREPVKRAIYLPAFHDGLVGANTFLIRTRIDPESLAAGVRSTVRETLRTVPVSRITTLSAQVDATIVPERLIAMLSGVFGALGAMLAAIGLYGLLAYTVARRRSEIGIRMALGATRGDVTRMVLIDALAMVGAGLSMGAPLALWGRRFAAGWVPGLAPDKIAPIAFGTLAMIAIGLLAAWLPSHRAASVDPMQALHYE